MKRDAENREHRWVKPDSCVRLFLGGDVMTGRTIDQLFATHNDDNFGKTDHIPSVRYLAWSAALHGAEILPLAHDYIWGDALGVLEQARPDFRLINLETAVTTAETWENKQFNYRMHPANISCLTAAGIDCCSLANNHLLDFGRAGMQETLRTLQGAGIGHAGAGNDLAEARRPYIHLLADGRRILVFSWGFRDSHIVSPQWAAGDQKPGINFLADCGIDTARVMAETMTVWREPGDLLVASLHWGANWVPRVPDAHRSLARYLIDQADVDIIHGHSSHHVLPVEIYRGKLILYGCGDLINDTEGRPDFLARRGYLGALYFVDFDVAARQFKGLHVQPVRRRRFRLELPTRDDAKWVIEQVRG